MSPPATSVIVVSQGRPGHLKLCLRALAQQDHPEFEIVVVADQPGLDAVSEVGLGDKVKQLRFDEANISTARNAGLRAASAPVVAFIDDDATAEPTWLSHLTAPFADTEVAAAGGYVLGRNGISFQSKAARVDDTARETPVEIPHDTPMILGSGLGDAVKTEGTNCAFRRDKLGALGGFDPAFRFFLDETDVNLRLAAQGARTALVPLARVHHSTAPSPRRGAARVPRTLHEIGASSAVFLRKHAAMQLEDGRKRLFQEQWHRLLRHMVGGTCEPRDVPRLLRTLADGWSEGMQRPLASLPPIDVADPPFLPFQADPPFKGMQVLSGRPWDLPRLRREARELVRHGTRVTLLAFSPSTAFHRVRFTPDGIWEQRGGVFGRSERIQPIFRPLSFQARVDEEWARIAPVRESS